MICLLCMLRSMEEVRLKQFQSPRRRLKAGRQVRFQRMRFFLWYFLHKWTEYLHYKIQNDRTPISRGSSQAYAHKSWQWWQLWRYVVQDRVQKYEVQFQAQWTKQHQAQSNKKQTKQTPWYSKHNKQGIYV